MSLGGTTGATLSRTVAPGDVLAGKYRVERVLGSGGMGVVVAAHHMQLETKVAIKFLLPGALENAAAVARFVREARAAVKIQSEHVARVIDVGTLETGSPYIVMEYLEGGDLDGWLKQRGALPFEQAVEFVLQASVAIAEAHGLGIVHRDLKPANLFCIRRADGQLSIKVLDFGVSKVADPAGMASAAMTRTNAVLGTPLYMSPEQMRSSKTVDARTDIWALGAVLYELVAGKPPFNAESVMDLAIKIYEEPPLPMTSFRPDIPPGLEAVILKCLEKSPARRYPNVGELAVALLPFAPKRARASVERVSGIIQAAGLSVSALDLPPSPKGDPPGPSGATLQPIGRTTHGSAQGKPAAIGLGVAALVAVVALGAFFFRSRSVPGATVAAATVAAPAEPLPAASTASEPPPAPSQAAPAEPPAPSVASMSSASASAVPPVDSAAALSVAKPAVSARASQSPPRVAKPAIDCTQPFTIDARNHHVPRPECL